MVDDYHGDPPIPPESKLCAYGRLGLVGRAIRDGWESIVKPWQVALMVLATGAFGGLFTAIAPAKASLIAHVGLFAAGALCALGSVVLIGIVWAFTPWGRRCHWDVVFHPFTFGFDGCSAVSRHWHSVDWIEAEVFGPKHYRMTIPMVYDPALTGHKMLFSPGDRAQTIQIPPGSDHGWYRFRWRAQLTGAPRKTTIARAWFRVKKP